MAQLSDKHKTFIVQQLAMFSTPQEVVDLVKNLFGVEIERGQVSNYDPTTSYFKGSKKWLEIYNATRNKFLSDTASIAVANKAYRLRELDTIYKNQKSVKVQNTVAMKDTLEQAAKESGDAFTNRREITGKGGDPLQVMPVTMEEWKAQQARRREQAERTSEMFRDDE